MQLSLPSNARAASGEGIGTSFHVFIDGTYAGTVIVADTPRPEAAISLKRLRSLGLSRIIMYTGDNPRTAQAVSTQLGISELRAGMSPKDKLDGLEQLLPEGPVAMVGDGINDAPALARSDVGIAMGGGGTAIASEAADVVILSDNLNRLPEIILLGRQTTSVIHWDMAIWVATNLAGFALVFTGIIGPSLAAFYNFATDFLPLLNSVRLFRKPPEQDIIAP
jgi:P-type E1-E2 ATPase